MDKQVLKIITENLTNERLDSLVRSIEEYKQAEQEADRMMSILEETLNQEQQKALNDYLSAENHRASVYTEISYKQGMKDVVAFLVALMDV